jgi:hypothetical protein
VIVASWMSNDWEGLGFAVCFILALSILPICFAHDIYDGVETSKAGLTHGEMGGKYFTCLIICLGAWMLGPAWIPAWVLSRNRYVGLAALPTLASLVVLCVYVAAKSRKHAVSFWAAVVASFSAVSIFCTTQLL